MEFEHSQGYLLGFVDPKDHYLGRLLAGLDANSLTFVAITPHVVEGNDYEYINEVKYLYFSSILDR